MGLTEHRRSWLKTGLGLCFSLIVLGWAYFALDWTGVWYSLVSARYGWVAVAVGLNVVAFVTRTIRWGRLLSPEPFQFKPYFSALIISQAANYLSPARIGDILRAHLLGESTGISKVRILSTVALEKLWDIVLLVLCTITVGWFFPLPAWLGQPLRLFMLGSFVSILILILMLGRQRQLLSWIGRLSQRVAPKLEQRLVALVQAALNGFTSAKDGRLIGEVAFWTLLTWLIGGLLNWTVFLALDIDLFWVPAFLLLVVLQVGVAAPSLPGRIGVFQGLCVVVLALFNIEYDVAFGYGVLLHLVVFLPPMLLSAALVLADVVGISPHPRATTSFASYRQWLTTRHK